MVETILLLIFNVEIYIISHTSVQKWPVARCSWLHKFYIHTIINIWEIIAPKLNALKPKLKYYH